MHSEISSQLPPLLLSSNFLESTMHRTCPMSNVNESNINVDQVNMHHVVSTLPAILHDNVQVPINNNHDNCVDAIHSRSVSLTTHGQPPGKDLEPTLSTAPCIPPTQHPLSSTTPFSAPNYPTVSPPIPLQMMDASSNLPDTSNQVDQRDPNHHNDTERDLCCVCMHCCSGDWFETVFKTEIAVFDLDNVAQGTREERTVILVKLFGLLTITAILVLNITSLLMFIPPFKSVVQNIRGPVIFSSCTFLSFSVFSCFARRTTQSRWTLHLCTPKSFYFLFFSYFRIMMTRTTRTTTRRLCSISS